MILTVRMGILPFLFLIVSSSQDEPNIWLRLARVVAFFLWTRMAIRIAEVCLAEPAIAELATLGSDNQPRLIPGRNPLAEYPARLILLFGSRFSSSADVIPKVQPY